MNKSVPYKHTPETKLEYAPCWHIYDTVPAKERYPSLARVNAGILDDMNALLVVCCWCNDKYELLDSWKPDTTIREHGEFVPGLMVTK